MFAMIRYWIILCGFIMSTTMLYRIYNQDVKDDRYAIAVFAGLIMFIACLAQLSYDLYRRFKK